MSELFQITQSVLKYVEYALMNPPSENARDKLIIAVRALLEQYDEIERGVSQTDAPP